MNERYTVTLPSDEKDGVEIKPKDLGDFIGRLECGKSQDVGSLPEWTSQLQCLLAVFEEAIAARRDHESSVAPRELDRAYEDALKGSGEERYWGKLKEFCEDWKADLADKDLASSFNMDGFYPYYWSQKMKILFIGREAYSMSGEDYMATLYKDLITNKFAGGWTVNQYPFHRRQFYLAYGILRAINNNGNAPAWSEIPMASNMAAGDNRIFAVNGGISWAFINLSKISNETGDWRLNGERFTRFISCEENQKRIREQIKYLKPDLIIAANIYEPVEILGYDPKKVDKTNPYCYYYEPVKSKTDPEWILPPFLNGYHFAAIKSDENCFYNPIMELVRKYYSKWNIGA